MGLCTFGVPAGKPSCIGFEIKISVNFILLVKFCVTVYGIFYFVLQKSVSQKLIYSGHLLNDEQQLKEVLSKVCS